MPFQIIALYTVFFLEQESFIFDILYTETFLLFHRMNLILNTLWPL